MGKLGRALVIICIAMTGIALIVGISKPTMFTDWPYYPYIAGIWVTITIGLWIYLGVLSESPRLKVTFGGGSRLGREDVGDYPLHVGGLIFSVVITATNTGARKLSLEPKMILREGRTGKKLYEMNLMPDCPLPAKKADKLAVGHYYAGERPPHCPALLELIPDETKRVHLEFIVEKDAVDRIGFTRVSQADYSLKFADNGLGIIFECVDKGRGIFECRRLRSH